MPHFEDGRHVLNHLREVERASVDEDQDDGPAGSRHRFYQLDLPARQVE